MTAVRSTEDTLQMAKLTASWLQRVGQCVADTTTGDCDLDEEVSRSIAIAQAMLLRWRLTVGVREGLLQIKHIEEYVEDN